MKLKYLGTGSAEGIPALFCTCPVCGRAREKGGKEVRHRSCVLIDSDTLIDMSPDLFSQTISLGLDVSGIRQVIFTHSHPDHFYFYDLLGLLPYASVRKSRHKLKIYMSAACLDEIKGALPDQLLTLLGDYAELITMAEFNKYSVFNAEVTPLRARHPVKDSYIYIIERDGRRILYGNDTGFFPEETWDFIYGMYFDFVSLDCSNVDSGSAGHMGLEDNITVKKRMFQQKNIDERTRFVSTHFSHMSGLGYYEIDEKLRLNGFSTAYDGMEVTV